MLRQTWEDFELVVVDDGSTDGTLAAARAVADPRLRVVAAPRNLGAAGARNRAAPVPEVGVEPTWPLRAGGF